MYGAAGECFRQQHPHLTPAEDRHMQDVVRACIEAVLGEEENVDQQILLPDQTKDGKDLNLGASW